MPVRVACTCGTSYELKDEFAGRLVKCPHCGRETRAPDVVAARAQADPVFERDIFLLRQKLLRISEKYDVADEHGQNIVFVERPAHFLRNVGALFAGVLAGGIVGGGIMAIAIVALGDLGDAANHEAAESFGTLAGLGFLATLFMVAILLGAKRHVTFYRDQSKRDRLLDILQDRKWQPITRTFTVRDAHGSVLARLSKNWLAGLFRKIWLCDGPDGGRLLVIKEDSVILSLLRRLLGSFFGMLRTNFLFLRPGGEDVIGEFKRKFTILDRYVLDLTADPGRIIDRRVALAIGVMLDTGERR